ncbi:MAG TPA: hypothetical protein VHP32_08765 [Ignavibacteria bacterium]|nr:hypothetical protein [Ignavibacteria bacterium]
MTHLFSISYDLHNPNDNENISNDDVRELIICLLVKEKCEPIKRYTATTIHFTSSNTFKFFVKLFEKHLSVYVTATIEKIIKTNEGLPRFQLLNRNKEIENNFDNEILEIQNMDSEKLESRILELSLNF